MQPLTKRERIFSLILENDPLFLKVEEGLRLAGRENAADALVKLQQDIGAEEYDDTLISPVKDFEVPTGVGAHRADAQAIQYEDSLSHQILEGYEPVLLERFSVLYVAQTILREQESAASAPFDSLMDDYHAILSEPLPATVPTVSSGSAPKP